MKPGRTPRAKAPAAAPGSVRIIAGRWRGTRLQVPALAGLRPSSDRVRETLFNWLQSGLSGARVLDAFAGTGALGLEAVSRGAASAVLIERDAGAARGLAATVAKLDATGQVQVVNTDALTWLAAPAAAAFDLVFLDPPFAAGLWGKAMAAVLPHLAPDAWIYVESAPDAPPVAPADWQLHREGRTRDVRFALYRNAAGQGADTLRGVHQEPEPA